MSHANALTSYIFFQDMIYINMCISLHTLHNVCTASYKKKTNFLCVEGSCFSTTKVRLNRKVKKKGLTWLRGQSLSVDSTQPVSSQSV